LGRHAAAATEANALTGRAQKNGPFLYDLARVYALARASALANGKLSPSERDTLSKTYATAALDRLTNALAAGHFADASHRQRLASDPDLASLRSLDDFKRLVSDVHSQ